MSIRFKVMDIKVVFVIIILEKISNRKDFDPTSTNLLIFISRLKYHYGLFLILDFC